MRPNLEPLTSHEHDIISNNTFVIIASSTVFIYNNISMYYLPLTNSTNKNKDGGNQVSG